MQAYVSWSHVWREGRKKGREERMKEREGGESGREERMKEREGGKSGREERERVGEGEGAKEGEERGLQKVGRKESVPTAS